MRYILRNSIIKIIRRFMIDSQKTQKITSVFQIVERQDNNNYKQLFEKERKARQFYQKKAIELEYKIHNILKTDHKYSKKMNTNKTNGLMKSVKSFKNVLPMSIKNIQVSFSDFDDKRITIEEYGIFGLRQEDLINRETQILYSTKNPSQTLKHTSNLVYPKGVLTKQFKGKEAYEKLMSLVNISKEKLRTFILTFQPSNFDHYKESETSNQVGPQQYVLNKTNPEGRLYGICLPVDDFIVNTNPAQNRKKELSIFVYQKIYCILTKYPFFNLFQQILVELLNQAKTERMIFFKENGQNPNEIDNNYHTELIANQFEAIMPEINAKPIKINTLLKFPIQTSKVYLQINEKDCSTFQAEEWAFPIISLFTLDNFMDLLTLIFLQEKIVFVCKNLTILTYSIFFFTKVLMRPFQYPYPLVNVIPDQEEYMSAPFPFVYGLCKQKEEVQRLKLDQKYKDVVFVYLNTDSVEITIKECQQKILRKKSPKLRNKLLQKFKKMNKHYPKNIVSSFLTILSKQQQTFSFTKNKDLSKQIINEVQSYIRQEIHANIPNPSDVKTIREKLLQERERNNQTYDEDFDEDDLNQETCLFVKELYKDRSKDPFFQAFLDTQILNVYLFNL